MPPSIDIRSELKIDDLRQINLDQWKRGPASYFGSNPEWVKPGREVLKGIEHPTYDVQAILDALPPYAVDNWQDCWAHHMALHAGCHPWPNANHRTAHRGFNLAIDRMFGWFAAFREPDLGHQLIADSHQQRDADGGEYMIAELQDPSHAYRQLFRQYAGKMTLMPIEGADEFPDFGER